MPGIGTTSSPRESTHASASCEGLTPFSAASSSTTATSSRLRWRFSSWKRGPRRRKSCSSRLVDGADAAGQEAAAERAVGDEADPELAHRRQDLRLGVARPERVLASAAPRSDGRRARGESCPERPRRARGSAPSPPARARPSRRPSPRSASRGRRGAGSRGRSSRLRGAPATPRRPSGRSPGLPLMPRNSPAGPRMFPNFVATTTWSRRSAIAFPTSRSFAPQPYMSAVSRKVTPSSSARWIVAIASPSSAAP